MMEEYRYNYLLVEWVLEKKFSVAKRSEVNPIWREKLDEELIGETIGILWRRKEFNALVIQCGNKIDMKHELTVLTQQHADSLAVSKKPVVDIAENIRGVLQQLDEFEDPQINLARENETLKLRLAEQKKLTEKFKEKAKALKRKLNDGNNNQENQNELEKIWDGVFLPKTQLQTIIAMSDDAGKLVRNLVRALYSDEELINHSLFGMKCNANKNQIPRPAIESTRRDAIILFAMEKFGGQQWTGATGKQKNHLLKSLHQIMGDQIRHITSKARKH